MVQPSAPKVRRGMIEMSISDQISSRLSAFRSARKRRHENHQYVPRLRTYFEAATENRARDHL
jgi:hypothetical protein